MRYWVDCSVDIHYPQFVFEIECDCCGKHFTDEHDVWQVGDKDYCWECWDRMEEANENDKRRKGKYIRVASTGWGDTIKIIGNIINDKWFDPVSFFEDKKEKADANKGDE